MPIFLIIYAFIVKENVAATAYINSGEEIKKETNLIKITKPNSLPKEKILSSNVMYMPFRFEKRLLKVELLILLISFT